MWRALFGGGNPPPVSNDEDGRSEIDVEQMIRDMLPPQLGRPFGGEGGRRQGDDDDRSEYLGMYS